MNSDEDNMNTAAISNSGQFSAANHTSYRNQLSSNEESQSVSAYVFSDSSQERDHGLLAMDDIKNDSDWQVSLAEVCTDGNGNFPEKSSDVIMLVSCSAERYPNANPFPVSLSDISEHLSSPHLATSRRQKAKDKYEIYENSKKNCANMGHCNKENRDPQMEYSWTVMADSKMGKRDSLPVLELLSSTMSFQENPCNCNNTMDSCICAAVSSEVDNVVEPFDRANQDKDCCSARYHEWPLVHVNFEPSYDIQSSLNESQSLPSSVNQDLIETVNDRWHSPSNSAETLFINNLSSTISTYISEDCHHSYISSRDTNESFEFDVDDSLHKIEDKDHDYMFDFPEHPHFESNFNRNSAIDSGKKQNSSYHLSEVNENKNSSSVLMNVSTIDFRNSCISDDLGACKEANNFLSAVEESRTGLTRTANCSEENCLLRRLHDYDPNNEPIHMTLEEVKTSLQQLAQGSSYHKTEEETGQLAEQNNFGIKNCARSAGKRTTFNIHLRQKKGRELSESEQAKGSQHRKSFPSSIKQTFCSIFGGKKNPDTEEVYHSHSKSNEELSCSDLTLNLLNTPSQSIPSLSPFANRALPPLPLNEDTLDQHLAERDSCIDENEMLSDPHNLRQSESMDFTASIHKVKDYGWYWGPISGETAEKILANEPDGSFIVRDSSDEHYIFSLTFKLNGMVRHVRIEHDQGNFSFGTFTNFKSQTIVGFIENAVEHSRSGRYLFFLHRRPVLGPMRVQLLHPVSRFKQIQSLQHMCRFVILKAVRRDLIDSLPLPKRLKHYLNTPQYYTEDVDITPADVNQPDLTPEHDLVHGNIELR